MPRSQAERQKALDRDRNECQICGSGIREGTAVHVHHHRKLGFGHKRLNDVAENMITLCPRCHDMVERSKWRITSLFPLEIIENGDPIKDLHRNMTTPPA